MRTTTKRYHVIHVTFEGKETIKELYGRKLEAQRRVDFLNNELGYWRKWESFKVKEKK